MSVFCDFLKDSKVTLRLPNEPTIIEKNLGTSHLIIVDKNNMLALKSQFSNDEQDVIRTTLKLPNDAICAQWVQVEHQKMYRLFAPMCGACLADPHKIHHHNESFIEVNSKFDKIRIFCEQHGERKIRGKAIQILREAFFGRRDGVPERGETPHMRLVHQLEDYAFTNRLRKSPKDKMVCV
jgi:hypothetical protein